VIVICAPPSSFVIVYLTFVNLARKKYKKAKKERNFLGKFESETYDDFHPRFILSAGVRLGTSLVGKKLRQHRRRLAFCQTNVINPVFRKESYLLMSARCASLLP